MKTTRKVFPIAANATMSPIAIASSTIVRTGRRISTRFDPLDSTRQL